MIKIHFSSATTSLLVGTAFLLPLFFLPFTVEMFDTNKRYLFLLITLIALLIGALRILVRKEIRLTKSPWTIPVTLFGISTLLTTLVITNNKVAALAGTGGLYLAFALLFLAGTSLIRKNFTNKLLGALTLASVLVTLSSLLEHFGFSTISLLNHLFNLNISTGAGFSITGSPLFSVLLLILTAVMLAIRFTQVKGKNKPLYAIFSVICVLGIGVNALGLLPNSPTHPQFLSFLDSWSVATDVVKTPLNAILGVGTDNYANAFSIFRPVRLNQSPIWFVRFNNARDSVLELLVTQGVLGLIAWALILLTSLRLIKTAHGEQLALGVGTLIIEGFFLLFPPNVLFIGLFCIFLIAWSASLKERGVLTQETVFSLFTIFDRKAESSVPASNVHGFITRIVAAVMLIAIMVGFYAVIRAYAADFLFNQSLTAAARGDGKSTYDFALNAITTDPYIENYHRTFAITNLSLAQVISQNKNLSDQDKQNVVTLIQQAIQQAKIATTLDPLDTANWDTLTTIYKALIGTASGADQWTVASFVEQAKTDPSNPQVRFNLGSVYRQIGNDDMALKLFEQAAQLKPDFANAYFNMADIYKKKGDKANELAMLQATLSLIKPDQTGYQDVKSRADQLQSELAASAANKQPTPAPTPTPTPEPTATPKPKRTVASPTPGVNLPSDAGLPQDGTVPAVPKQ